MDIRYLKGVGEKMALKFAKLGIFTAEQLLCHYPREYIDYSLPYPILSAPFDAKCVVKATVYEKNTMGLRVHGGKKIYKATAGDETASLVLTWFNTPYAVSALNVGQEYLFYGKIGGTRIVREMVSPQIISASKAVLEPFVPVYHMTEGLTSNYIAKCVKSAFAALITVPEFLPEAMLQKYKLSSRLDAVRKIHFPKTQDDIKAAKRRLIFEELLVLQLGLLQLRGRDRQLTGAVMHEVRLKEFWANVGFEPTNAQIRSANELCADLCRNYPANRLLQGDVGSGKTIVAAAGIYAAFKNGYQSVLMAPTELLAAQHAASLQKVLAPFGIKNALLTSSVKGSDKKKIYAQIEKGEVHLVIGTHAVLNDNVKFKNLGFAVTDEQHRFGVRQRSVLAQKANHPHLLVMSATPIPRTLALIMFGDLDVSVLDEMPKGRKPVKTYLMSGKKRADLYGFLKQRIEMGEQAYIVCPLVEEGETELLAATTYFEQIAKPLLPSAKIGLMHGRLKAKEKTEVMDKFRSGELDILVATTVIEVGVDVPKASTIVIENAERYGLSALHQLRGRVGRGKTESFCFLVSDHNTQIAKDRLSFLCTTHDGFEVARFDLETRGPGDFFGNRQHGLPTLQIADLAQDTRVLAAAQAEAAEIVQQDPHFTTAQYQGLYSAVKNLFSEQNSMN